MTNLYDELGVEPDATPAAIKAAHRKLVKAHHPDAGGDGDAFRRAQHAYDILSDPERRERYDRTGDDRLRDHASMIEGLARQEFAQLLLEPVANDDPYLFRRDLIASATGKVKQAQTAASSNMKDLKRRRERVEQVSTRFKPKGNSTAARDVFAHALRDVDRAIAALEERQAVLTRVLELLGEYEFEFDKPEPGGSTTFKDDLQDLMRRQAFNQTSWWRTA